MSVEVSLYGFVGIKGDYYDFVFFKNSADVEIKFYDLEDYKNVIYTDYLPHNFTYGCDGMSAEYSFIGRRLFLEDELYNGLNFEINPEKLQEYKNEVIKELKNLKIKFNEDDVKLHVFTHFS